MRLHEILKERGLSKLQLARKSEIAPSDLYHAMNGKKPFYPAWRKRIADYLQMDESKLFDAIEIKKDGGTNANN